MEEGNPSFEKDFVESVKEGIMRQDQYDWFCKATNNLYGASPERQLAFACKNAGFFAMSLMLAAKDAGLDSHPMDGFDIDGVRKASTFPTNTGFRFCWPSATSTKQKPSPPPKWRKSYEEIVY